MLALTPGTAWVALGWYGAHQWACRNILAGLPGTLVRSAGASLADANARYFYPHRLEDKHVVMFYDNRIADPQGDLQRMEDFLGRLEALTRSGIREKVYWIRGAFHGHHFAMYGLAVGTSQSPCGHVDFHEVAHAFLNQHRLRGAGAPMALVEGWAEAQSRNGYALSREAITFRREFSFWARDWPTMSPSDKQKFFENHADPWGWKRLLDSQPDSLLRALMTDPFWSLHNAGPVYSVGGAFVDFFIQRYGFAKFLELYLKSGAGGFELACRDLCGRDLELLETEFWNYAEEVSRAH
jgi:hypothetical protein